VTVTIFTFGTVNYGHKPGSLLPGIGQLSNGGHDRYKFYGRFY